MASTKDLFERALREEGINGPLADIARSIYRQESSSGKNTKTSNAGAVGGMQILPGTFKQVADKGWNIQDPLHNARAGIRYVRDMYKRAGGDPELTAIGYYGGPGGMRKARQGIAVSDPRNPNAPTTLEYGRQVASRLPGAATKPAQPLPPVGAAFGVYPSSGAGRNQGPVPVTSEELASPVPVTAGPTVNPQAAAAPVAPTPVAAAPVQPGVDPWQAFLAQSREPVQATDLAYGNREAVVPAPVFEVNVPNFMGAVASRSNTPDFSSFARFGRRART